MCFLFIFFVFMLCVFCVCYIVSCIKYQFVVHPMVQMIYEQKNAEGTMVLYITNFYFSNFFVHVFFVLFFVFLMCDCR